MALSLKVAELYADLVIKTAAFDRMMAKVEKRLAGLKDPQLAFKVDTSAATAAVDALLTRVKQVQAASNFRVGRGGGAGGGGGTPSYASAAVVGQTAPGGLAPGTGFVGLSSVQMAGIKLQDQMRQATLDADARFQAAQQKAVASQAKAAQKAYDDRVAAARKAADAQIAADARVQAAHQRSVAAQTAAADRAYARQVAAANRAAAAQARAAARAAAASHAAFARGAGQFGMGVGQGLGMPFALSPQMMAGQLVGSGLRAAVGTAIDLESKFAEVRRVAGLTADETARLKEELMAISAIQPGVTLDDLIKMADVGGRMGLAGKDLSTFASGLAMVKNSVSGMDTEDLANNMARVLHVFKLGPEYIKGFGSALTAMDNASTASASDILQITQGLSGTASAIGLTLPQVVALSAALKDVGLTNAVASTSMSQVFRKMATEMDKFAAAAQVDAKTFADAYRRDPMQALALLMNRLNSMKDTIAVQETLKSLGLEGLRVGGALQQLASAFDKVAPLTATANAEFATLKSLLGADGLKGDTTAASLTKLGNAATGLGDTIGSVFIPTIRTATESLQSMTTAADSAFDAMERAMSAKGGAKGGGIGGFIAGIFAPEVGSPLWAMQKMREIQAKAGNAAPPALPAKVPFVPPVDAAAPKIAAADQVIQRWASRLGFTLDRKFRDADRAHDRDADKPADKGGRGILNFGFRGDGSGLIGRFGQLGRGLLTGNLADKLGGADALSGGKLAALAASAARALAPPKETKRAEVGMTGADFAQRQQEDSLNGRKQDEMLGETKGIGATLREMRDILNRGAGAATPPGILGP